MLPFARPARGPRRAREPRTGDAPRPARAPRTPGAARTPRAALLAATALAAALATTPAAFAAAPSYDVPTGAQPFAAVTAENAPNPTDLQAVLDLGETTADAGVPRCLGASSFAHTGWAWVAPDERPRVVRVSATPVAANTGAITTTAPDLAFFVQPLGGTPQSAQVPEPQLCDGRDVFGDTARGDVDPEVTAILPAGRPALVQVGWRDGDGLGPVVASLAATRIDALPAPAGDDPAGAPVVAQGETAVPLAGATLGQGDPAQPACQAPGTVWRRFVATAGTTVSVSADGAATTLTALGDPVSGDAALTCADAGDGRGLNVAFQARTTGTVWLRLGVDQPVAQASTRLRILGPAAGTGPPPTPTAADALLQCTTHKLLLTNARTRGRSKVRLDGVAGTRYAGRRIALRLLGRKRAVATVKVARNGSFARTFSVPKAGRRSRARYFATMGTVKSARVPLRPRFAVTSVGRVGTTRVAFRGRLSKPLSAKRAVRLQTATCAKGRATWRTVRTTKRSRTGAVSARIARPAGAPVVVVRAVGSVRKKARGRSVSAVTLTQAVGF